MGFPSIAALKAALEQAGYLTASGLALPSANSLGSPELTALVGGGLYDASTLSLALTAPAEVAAATLVLRGTLQQNFFGAAQPASTVTFFLDGSGAAQLTHAVTPPPGWTWAAAFPALPGVLPTLPFTGAQLTANSSATPPLAFSGAVPMSAAPLRQIAWLWRGRDTIALEGAVTQATGAGAPQVSLASVQLATGLALGQVALTAALTVAAGDAQPGVAARVTVGGKIVELIGSASSIAGAPFALATGSAAQPLATLDDLTALAGGTALANLVPSHLPLGDHLALVGAQLTLDPYSQSILLLGLDVGLVGIDWTIVPPSLLVLEQIVLSFGVASPTSSPALLVAANAQVAIAGAQIAVGTSIPALRPIVGGLVPGSTIDLGDLVAHFAGATDSLGGALVIDALSMTLDPTDKTYSLDAGVRVGDQLALSLGADLPVPSIALTAITLSLRRTPTELALAVGAGLHFLGHDWTVSAARPGAGAGWTFTGRLDPGAALTLQDIVDGLLPASWALKLPFASALPKVTALEAAFNTAASTFALDGAIDWTLPLIPGELEIHTSAQLHLQSRRGSSTQAAQYSGSVVAEIDLNQIPLTATYSFQPGSSTIAFAFKGITATYVSDATDPALRVSFGDQTVGGVLDFLVELGGLGGVSLPSPWDVLTSIPLHGLLIDIHLKSKSLQITYSIERDFGFISISKIGFNYRRLYGKGKIELIVEGSVLGQSYTGANALRWDPVNSAPPAVPGASAPAFDLEYLGLGQHVSLRGASGLTTVEQAIAALKQAVRPIDDPSQNPASLLPGIEFNSGSNWLIGADFSVGGFLSMSLIFNDPQLYGLLITMQGKRAGSFAGLRFEILYRKISDDLGVYHIDLKLPDAMRRFQLGAVTITLPVATIDVYTNGNFRVDLGFPTSLYDFSRCFSVELFPFIGYGGFYFAKLDGQTSTRVPVIDNGRFSPVIEFGVALSVGLGKTLSLGILSGGISITVTGMLEGVYGHFEPSDASQSSAVYFSLDGTVAVVGIVWATVDFGIISASVNLTVYAAVSVLYESYQPIRLELEAGVSVRVSIKIIFVRIHFSFSATIRESFTIGSASTPPWHLKSGQPARARLGQRLAPRRVVAAQRRMRGRVARPLLAMTAPPITVPLLATPLVTKARASDLAPGGPAPASDTDEVAIAAVLLVGMDAPAGSTSGFAQLVSRLLRWVLVEVGEVGALVTAADLEDLLAELARPETLDQHFSYANLQAFFAGNISFQLGARPVAGAEVRGAFFPMIPALRLDTPGRAYDFGGAEHAVPAAYEAQVGRYFDELAVQYANAVELDPDEQGAGPAPAGAAETAATLVFRKYFALLARGVTQSAIELLRAYRYTVAEPASASLDSIAASFAGGPGATELAYTTHRHDTLASIAAAFGIAEAALASENPGVDESPPAGTVLTIPVEVTARAVVAANSAATGLLQPWAAGAPAAPGGRERPVLRGVRYSAAQDDTLGGIATRFGVTVDDLAQLNAAAEGLLRPGARLELGDVTVALRDVDTVQSLAAWFGVPADGPLAGVALGAGQVLLGSGASYTTRAGDTLASAAAQLQLGVDALLALNPAIHVAGGASLILPALAHVVSGALVVSYVAAAGDTLDAILTRYFGAPDDALRALVAAWNPGVALGALEAGTALRFPYAETLDHVSRYYGTPLVPAANVTAGGLLAPGASLAMPPIAPVIGADDSLGGIAARYALDLDALADELAGVTGLFRDADAGGPPVLTIAHLPAIDGDHLADALLASGKLDDVGAMASRFLLHGLRLPSPSDPRFQGAFDAASLATFPLFAITGQLAAPTVAPADFTLSLTNAAGAGWVQTADGSGRITLSLSSDEQQQVADFAQTALHPAVQEIHRLPLAGYARTHQALHAFAPWQPGDPSTAGIPSADDQLAGLPGVWQLPDALTAGAGDAGAPWELVISSGSATAPVERWGWGTQVTLRLRRAPAPAGAPSAYVPNTYLMIGADQDGAQRLARVRTALDAAPSETATLSLLFAQAAGSGYASDAVDRAGSRLIKTNLSTVTHSAPPHTAALAAPAPPAIAASLGSADARDFLRLLWECSVVNSGGFYLVYRTADGAELPARLFQDSGEAEIELLLMLGSQAASPGALLRGFNNVAVVRDAIDLSRSTVHAQTLVRAAVPGDTLGAIAAAYPQVGAGAASLAAANADIRNQLRPGAALAVPGREDYVVQHGDTWGGVAAALSLADPGTLGAANAGRDVFVTGALVQLVSGQLQLAATLPPGHTGFFAARPNPDPGGRGLGQADPAGELASLFNLLGFRVRGNSFFAASGDGLPAGPTTASADTTTWIYQQALRVSPRALRNPAPDCAALPPRAENPYAGIERGATVELELAFQDVLGGRATPDQAPVLPPLAIGYTDELLGLSRWPSTTASYAFSAPSGTPQLEVDATFGAAKYLPAIGRDYPVTHASARADRERFAEIYYQVWPAPIDVTLDCSLGALALEDGAAARALRELAASAYVFLSAAAGAGPITAVTAAPVPPSTGDTLEGIAARFGVAAGALAEANADVDAAALFGGAPLTVPLSVVARAGETLAQLVGRVPSPPPDLVARLAAASAAASLEARTVWRARTRSFTAGAGTRFADVAQLESTALDGEFGLAAANAAAPLAPGVRLTLDGVTLTAIPGETLGGIAARFAQSVDGATIDWVVVANRLQPGLIALGTALALPSYVAQGGDTLASVASGIGAATPGDPAEQLLLDNQAVADLFPAGTALRYGAAQVAAPGGVSLRQFADAHALDVAALGAENAALALAPRQALRVPFLLDSSTVAASTYRAATGQSFGDVASAYPGWDVGALAALNQDVPALFDPSSTITLGGQSRQPALGDTFATLAQAFALPLAQLAAQIAPVAGLVRGGALVLAPALEAQPGETLGALAARAHAGAAELADANAATWQSLAGGDRAAIGDDTLDVAATDTLGGLAARFDALRAARQLPPSVTAADVGRLNPDLKLRAGANFFPPVRAAVLTATVQPSYDAPITPLAVNLTLARDAALVDPELAGQPTVSAAGGPIAARPFADAAAGADAALSLRAFAASFEDTFPGIKLATGQDRGDRGDALRRACGQGAQVLGQRAAAGDALAGLHLWAVNLGAQGPQSARFNYNVDGSAAQYYALAPLSTQLWDVEDLTLQTYVSGTGLGAPEVRSLRSADVDTWLRDLAAAVDAFLAPDLAAARFAIDEGASFARAVAVKGALAAKLRDNLQPVLDHPSGDLDEARDAFYQQLLVELSSAYTTDVVVQLPFDVASGCAAVKTAARLSGKPLARVYRTPADAPTGVAELAATLNVSAPYLCAALAETTGLVASGLALDFGGQKYSTGAAETLSTIAAAFGVGPDALAAGLTVAGGAGLFRAGSVVDVAVRRHPVSAGDRLSAIAAALDTTVERVLTANQALPDLFAAGSTVSAGGHSAAVRPGDTPLAIAGALGLTLDGLADALWNGDRGGPAIYTLRAGAIVATLSLPPAYTFTTGKVPLASGRRSVSFLFNVKDAALTRSVPVDLDFAVTQLEYDIVERPELGGYQESSWLNLVLPLAPDASARFPNRGAAGALEIPVPLRAYPQPPTLSSQSGTPSPSSGAQSAFEWSYGVALERRAAAQDRGYLRVQLNSTVDGAPPPALESRAPLLAALAQFELVWPQVAADLALLALPAPAPAQSSAARVACGTFVDLVEKVVAAWPAHPVFGQTVADGDIYDYRLDTIPSESVPGQADFLVMSYLAGPSDYLFAIAAGDSAALDAGQLSSALRDELAARGWGLSAAASVTGASAAGGWTVVDDADQRRYTFDLRPAVEPAGAVIEVRRKYLWPRVLDGASQTPLAGAQYGDQLVLDWRRPFGAAAELRFEFDRLSLIAKQNGWAGAHVTRNESLVGGRVTNPAFVYTTPLVQLPTKLTPHIVVPDPISLGGYAPAGADLTSALSGFFATLLAPQAVVDPTGVRDLKLTVTYEFALADGGGASLHPRFPLLHVPLAELAVASDWRPTASFVATLAAEVRSARAAVGAPAAAGRYAFDLTVYSTLGTALTRPLLEIAHLYYALPEPG